MITFQKEPFATAFPDAQRLFADHFDEVAENKKLLGAPNPDVDGYATMDRMGAYHVLTARDGEELVGYFAFITRRNFHYKHIISASEDLYFLAPEARGMKTGYRFLQAATDAMRAAGGDLASMRVKIAHDHGPLLERLGYRPIEVIYTKVLREGGADGH